MGDDQHDPQTVSYPLPTVLDRLQSSVDGLRNDMNGRLDRIEGQLAQKADKADLVGLTGRVTALELERAERTKAREVNQEHKQAALSSRQASWAIFLGAAGVLAAVAEAIVQAVSSAH
jgi:hypothetical protein